MGTHRWMAAIAAAVLPCAGIWLAMETAGATRAVDTPATLAKPERTRNHVLADDPVQAGRYLVAIAGCNDCHTPAFMEKNGDVPESQWMTGSPMGWRGPWGTTYPTNLRLYVQDFDEKTWVMVLRARNDRPPMPWASLHAMSDADLIALYHYLKASGPAGQAMPKAVPPDEEPDTPYLLMVPQMPGTQ